MSVHLVLLALSCGALAAAAAGGPLVGLTRDLRRARQMAILVSTALVAGNAACLLPDTPAWYSAALVALTVGGLVWLLVSLVAVRQNERTAARAATTALAFDRQDPPQLVMVRGARTAPQAVPAPARPSARPHLALLPGGAQAGPAGDQATGAAPNAPARPGTSYAVVDATEVIVDADEVQADEVWADARAVVTRRELDTIGPRWTRSQSVSVARGIRTLAPESGRRRAQGSGFDRRGHTADGAVLRAQLKAMYADPTATPVRRRGTQA